MGLWVHRIFKESRNHKHEQYVPLGVYLVTYLEFIRIPVTHFNFIFPHNLRSPKQYDIEVMDFLDQVIHSIVEATNANI